MFDYRIYSPTSPTISSFPKNNRKSVTLSKTATLRENEDYDLRIRNKQKELCTKYVFSGKHVRPFTWSSSSWGEGRRLEQTHKSFYHKSPPAGEQKVHHIQAFHHSSYCVEIREAEWRDTPWCRHFCSGTWCIFPDTRSSTSDSTTGTWQIYFGLL